MPEHIQTCFVVFASLHHNLITVMRRKANLLQARAGQTKKKHYLDKIEELQLLSISMVPPCVDPAEMPNNSSV